MSQNEIPPAIFCLSASASSVIPLRVEAASLVYLPCKDAPGLYHLACACVQQLDMDELGNSSQEPSSGDVSTILAVNPPGFLGNESSIPSGQSADLLSVKTWGHLALFCDRSL